MFFLCVLCVLCGEFRPADRLVLARQSPAKPPQRQGVLVDQLVVTVNGEAVTRSDLVWLLALDPKAVVPTADTAELRRILETEIDRKLLDQEAKRLPNVVITTDDVKNEERRIIARFPSELVFRQRLEAVGLPPAEFSAIAREQVEIEKYTDFRFRSFVIVTEEEILNYYRASVRPLAAARGQVLPEDPTTDDRQLIEKILLEDEVESETKRWLETARARAEIVYLAPFAKPTKN